MIVEGVSPATRSLNGKTDRTVTVGSLAPMAMSSDAPAGPWGRDREKGEREGGEGERERERRGRQAEGNR
jgi:hypothetical protein